MKKLFLLTFICLSDAAISQVLSDSALNSHQNTLEKHTQLIQVIRDSVHRLGIQMDHFNEDQVFTGTRIISKQEKASESPHIALGGYISTFYAWYSDTGDVNNFQKFPTAAPQNNALSLNLAQLSARYASRSARANLVLHFGDMPRSAWSPIYNYVQEANAGIKLANKFWLDMGFFRTHIGLESIQPRENIASSVAVPTYFEPYYLSGAKLSYSASDKLTLQLNAFNTFNGFIETNSKKAIGFSMMYDILPNLSLTFNSLWNDDSPDSSDITHGRLYNNLYMVYRSERLTAGIEANYGLQEHTSLSGAQKTAWLFSSLLALKYKVLQQWYGYTRLEYFNDPDELLTGPEYNQNKQLIGLNISGGTLGVEYKPRQNAYLRLEGRSLITYGSNEQIFLLDGKSSSVRNEAIFSFGVWF